MVISGHNHNYERTYPVYKRKQIANNYENPAAPVYAVIGSAGVRNFFIIVNYNCRKDTY